MTNRKRIDESDALNAELPPHSLHHYLDNTNQSTCFATLPSETPLAISYNGVSHAVMMTTPQDVEDFIYGFSFTERIIRDCTEVHDIIIEPQDDALIVDVKLANRAQARLSLTKRHLAGRTGCGICGAESLEQAIPGFEPQPFVEPLSDTAILKLRDSLRQWQSLGHISGAIHAALLVDDKGEILLCREDIGRHNALDKAIGTALRGKALMSSQAILVTSRCSIELVQKTLMAGVGTLITLGTPTSLAVSTAIKTNLNLVHLPRTDSPRFYNRASHDTLEP